MENIIIRNATAHNLKNVCVKIPINRFTCVTGVSGGGKSSLVYDTLYAESQRAFLESMATNLFGERLMDKPPVDSIENLRPALKVAQQYYNYNPRSTVGTLSDVSHHIRSLFAIVSNEQYGTDNNERIFSPNDIAGCCPHCKGLGDEYVLDMDALIPDPECPLNRGAIRYYAGISSSQEYKTLEKMCEHFGIDFTKKVSQLSNQERYWLMYREDEIELAMRFKSAKGRYRQKVIHSRGVIPELQSQLKNIDSPSVFSSIGKYLKKDVCSVCLGARLKPESLSYNINRLNIAQVEHLQLTDLIIWASEVKLVYSSSAINNLIDTLVDQICNTITKIINLNLEYLSIDRSIPSLSGGELQRLRIGIQLGCPLSGLIYILDEPCRGLHERNVQNLIEATTKLTDKGNTVIAIEHNPKYISHADRIIELGPVGGPSGGFLLNDDVSPSSFKRNIVFKPKSPIKGPYIKLSGIEFHNLHNQEAIIPTGNITCITGVSGSGKSSFMDVLKDCLDANRPIHCSAWNCPTTLKKAVYVNQQPIGKTPRSTVLSYLDLSTPLRLLFANTTHAQALGLASVDFSINVAGGRCEVCQGTGLKRIELNYMPDTYIQCPDCHGSRFSSEILDVYYNGKNILEYLESPIESISGCFSDHEGIAKKLQCVIEIGLGYLSLGQMSMNLSGGEAQRIKLAKALSEKGHGHMIYLLDEPTSGLHFSDIQRLQTILQQICESGNTVVMIEHNLEFIANTADYMIDFGKKAGDKGGQIIAQGCPEAVCANKYSSWDGTF